MDDKYNTLRSMKAANALGMSAQELTDAAERGETIVTSGLKLLEVWETTPEVSPTISIDTGGKKHIFALPVAERHVETVIETKVDHSKFVTKEGAGGLPWVCLPVENGQDIPLVPIMPGTDGLATAKRHAVEALRTVLTKTTTAKTALPSATITPAPPQPPAAPQKPPAACTRPASTGATVPPPVAPPPPPPTAPIAPLPTQKGIYKVAATAIHGPAPSSDQQYLHVTLVSDDDETDKVVLRFYRNAKGDLAQKWDNLLAQFLIKLGIPEINDTEQLHGREIALHCNFGNRTTIAGLDTVAATLGVSAH